MLTEKPKTLLNGKDSRIFWSFDGSVWFFLRVKQELFNSVKQLNGLKVLDSVYYYFTNRVVLYLPEHLEIKKDRVRNGEN